MYNPQEKKLDPRTLTLVDTSSDTPRGIRDSCLIAHRSRSGLLRPSQQDFLRTKKSVGC